MIITRKILYRKARVKKDLKLEKARQKRLSKRCQSLSDEGLLAEIARRSTVAAVKASPVAPSLVRGPTAGVVLLVARTP